MPYETREINLARDFEISPSGRKIPAGIYLFTIFLKQLGPTLGSWPVWASLAVMKDGKPDPEGTHILVTTEEIPDLVDRALPPNAK